jgi:hypothetical protein
VWIVTYFNRTEYQRLPEFRDRDEGQVYVFLTLKEAELEARYKYKGKPEKYDSTVWPNYFLTGGH